MLVIYMASLMTIYTLVIIFPKPFATFATVRPFNSTQTISENSVVSITNIRTIPPCSCNTSKKANHPGNSKDTNKLQPPLINLAKTTTRTGKSKGTSDQRPRLINLAKKTIHSGLSSKTKTHFTTVVSMYFKLSASKHSISQYNSWIANMLKSIQAPLVMYTDSKSIEFLQANRNSSHYTTTYFIYDDIWGVMRELELRRNMSYLVPYQKEQHDKDAERRIHNPSLYACWNLKTYILAKASEMNEYNSEFFMYTDAGAWREKAFTDWPHEEFVRNVSQRLNDRMLFGQVYDKRRLFNVGQDHIEGTFFAGSKLAIAAYERAFYDQHDLWLQAGFFIGKDQTMMNMLAFVTHKESIVRLQAWDAAQGCCNRWHFYQRFFAQPKQYNCRVHDRLSLLIEMKKNS